jgi:NagD protein
MATARFLAQQKPGGTAFVIGEGGLLTALHQNGYAVVNHEPDYVVVGEGRTFNLELVEAAVRMIYGGAKLIATNLDPNCPTQNGLRPGCGAMVAMLETAPRISVSIVSPIIVVSSLARPNALRAARIITGLGLPTLNRVGASGLSTRTGRRISRGAGDPLGQVRLASPLAGPGAASQRPTPSKGPG